MATMNISLPDEMKAVVESRVGAGAYANVSDYVRALIRADITGEGHWEIDDQMSAAIDVGEASGYTPYSFKDIIAEARARFDAK